MTFLTILTVLLINHYWQREPRLDFDAWQLPLQRGLQTLHQRLPDSLQSWPFLLPIVAVLLPTVTVALLLWLANGVWLGLLSFGLHVGVLMYCCARFNVGAVVAMFQQHWRDGDYEAAYLSVNEVAPDVFKADPEDYASMHRSVMDWLQRVVFRQLFAVLFWYVIAGALGALVYALLVNMRQQQHWSGQRRLHEMLDTLVALLEWVPVRLLAIGYALAGDFVATFTELRRHVLNGVDDHSNQALLSACALAACGSPAVEREQAGGKEGARLGAWYELQLRTQVVWVAVLAVIILVV